MVVAKPLFLVLKGFILNAVDEESEEEDNDVDEDREDHFVSLTLLNAELPNVKHKTTLVSLLFLSKVLNVLDQPFVDRFLVERVHFKHAIAGLAQVERTHTDGVLALIDQVYNLHNYRVLQELLHVHLVHDVQAVFHLRQVQDGFAHELMQHQNIVLLLKVLLQGVDEVGLKDTALCDERVNLLFLDSPADLVN